MRKVVWKGADTFEMVDVNGPTAQALGARQLLLRVKAVGLCATDIHILDGHFPSVKPPRVLGHEIAGVVEAVGPEVRQLSPGTRVTCDSVVGCGRCHYCARGSRQFCVEGYELGFTRDGGCQEFLVLPEENAHPVDSQISMEEAAILDMEVYSALEKPGIRPGASVLIAGSGPAGLIAVQIARILGAGKVLLSGDSGQRLALGHELGAARAIDIRKEDLGEAVKQETHGLGVDLAMDCAGTAESFRQVVDSVTPGGIVVLYGIYPEPLRSASVLPLVLKDITVYGSCSDRVGWNEVINLAERGQLNLKRLITHTFPLSKAPEAYQIVRDRSHGFVKAVLQL
jgi:threonine dehydrogenase-like Zn-dependent dehydrogenase